MNELVAAVGEGRVASVAAALRSSPASANGRDGRDVTSLWAAVNADLQDLVDLLLTHGADPNLKSSGASTPFHLAIMGAKEHLIELMLDRKTDPNVKDGQGQTALHVAARWANARIAELLLRAGADLNVKDASGRTPLGIAVNERKDVAEVLRKRGAKE